MPVYKVFGRLRLDYLTFKATVEYRVSSGHCGISKIILESKNK